MKKVQIIPLILLLSLSFFTGCSSSSKTTDASGASSEGSAGTVSGASASESSGKVRKIKISFGQTGKPYGYVDDNGNATGYDIEALRLVDGLLPDYEFEYVPTDSQDAWTGTREGKYQVAVTNSFWTQERARNYIIPEENLGGSIGGLIVRKENKDVKSFSDAAKKGLKLVPIKAGDGWQYVVESYNKENPQNQIKLELSDSQDWTAGFTYVAEGRYDVFGTIKSSFATNVADSKGDLHNLADKLVCNEFTTIKTYTLINKNETDLAKQVNDALKTLKKGDKLVQFSEQFYGENVFRYLK
ncbi:MULTISPECIES: transporter substrate-binding domain-containing protein [Acutalibacteraceae]|uniref:transporter substrate-binding domain-containing protein n=1 Tax=Acutalibacteraceae TaxID=3082771 RepID=UPI0013E8BE7F|nr:MULTISPECIES: transporter substrate-binding domain-containing protein [Acutalibacteraceae]